MHTDARSRTWAAGTVLLPPPPSSEPPTLPDGEPYCAHAVEVVSGPPPPPHRPWWWPLIVLLVALYWCAVGIMCMRAGLALYRVWWSH